MGTHLNNSYFPPTSSNIARKLTFSFFSPQQQGGIQRPGGPAAPAAAAQPTPAQSSGPQPAQGGAAAQNGGQPDFSAQWAEYYRSIGKHKEAEAIEAQMKAKVSGVKLISPRNQRAQI